MVDYKEQILIIGIKTNIQYFIYYALPKKRELVIRTADLLVNMDSACTIM